MEVKKKQYKTKCAVVGIRKAKVNKTTKDSMKTGYIF